MVTTGEKSAGETAAVAAANAADANSAGEDDSKQALLKGDEVNGLDGAEAAHEGGGRPGDIEMAEVARVPEVRIAGDGGGVKSGDVEAGGDGGACVEKRQKKSAAPCQAVGGGGGGSLVQFSGLTKEELEEFARDPFWRRLRLILFVLFWVVWIGMFTAVIVIIVVSPKCPPRQARPFWQKPFYRIQVRSFAPDPDAAAAPSRAGSLAGVEHRLPYLRQTLGVNNFLLSSLVKTEPASGCPMDFAAPDPALCSLDRLRSLAKAGRRRGFQVMMELDVSQADPAWGPGVPPGDGFFRDATNFDRMLSRDGKPAWSGNLLRMPRSACVSLNVSSERTRRALFNAMTAWLDAGLSGFLLTNVAFLMPKKTNQVTDLSPPPASAPPSDWYKRDPRGFLFTDEAAAFVRAARAFLDAEAARLGRDLALFVDFGDLAYPVPDDRVAAFAGPGGAHVVINAGLGDPMSPLAVPKVRGGHRAVAEAALAGVKSGGVLAWATNWHSLRRDPSPALLVLGLTLPGVGGIYYGQELGMGHIGGFHLLPPAGYLLGDEAVDPAQSPMQWSGNPENAGWLPPPPANVTSTSQQQQLNWTVDLELRRADILENNLHRLSASGHPDSNLQLTQALVRLTGRLESLQWGDIAFLGSQQFPDLIAYSRKAVQFPAVLVLINTAANRTFTVDTPAEIGPGGKLELMHRWGGGGGSSYAVGQRYEFGGIFVPERTALVFVADA